ncbi:hypothetical protein B0H11DRAFT_2050742, partial [Mycena galericulata]
MGEFFFVSLFLFLFLVWVPFFSAGSGSLFLRCFPLSTPRWRSFLRSFPLALYFFVFPIFISVSFPPAPHAPFFAAWASSVWCALQGHGSSHDGLRCVPRAVPQI